MMAKSLDGKSRTTVLAMALASLRSAAIVSVMSMPAHAAQGDETPVTINTGELLGRWGIASFENPVDRARTEIAARTQCQTPYVIRAGRSGGIMMHQVNQTSPQELWLKGSPSGKYYVGPPGPTPGERDREIVSYDGQIMIMRFVDTNAAIRYGNMVYARCETGIWGR
jgi:hypothetical protein